MNVNFTLYNFSRDDKKSGDSDSDSDDPEKKKLQSKLEGAIGKCFNVVKLGFFLLNFSLLPQLLKNLTLNGQMWQDWI